jgi:uncharacterized protein YceK
MKKLVTLVFLALIGLSGCASLQSAGSATYTVQPFAVDGKLVCCQVSVADGKERAALTLDVIKSGDNYTIHLDERGVQAFAGQAIAAGAQEAAIERATRVAVGAALAPIVPVLIPASGAALVSPGIGAAAVGAAGALAVDRVVGQ